MDKLIYAILGISVVGAVALAVNQSNTNSTAKSSSSATTSTDVNQYGLSQGTGTTEGTGPSQYTNLLSPTQPSTPTGDQIPTYITGQIDFTPTGVMPIASIAVKENNINNSNNIIITGSGFTPNSTIDLLWGTQALASATSNSMGNVTFDTTASQLASNSLGNLGYGSISYNIGLTAFDTATDKSANSVSVTI